ncbi:MAG: AAA family ATPase [Odoribacter sp. 43_10]|jgi:SMC domain protein|uniref:AAA family ATPase n=1 Tax=Odoribacter splanchnicus TaxID=28118 RepID=UPI00095E22A0|nr:ATP-binding protein [Odoribacter splanchnicus]MBS6593424.1 AAA family ATPase [Odoribacter splanchnicus]OKZ39773.1 MAG: AAA family ATPase [Odoribacter sp. 43_10]SPY23240.1 Predicted ATPase [Odoribacter splanchnicus]
MIISKIELFNWKNFHRCEVGVQERCFVVGANAAGKSNFIDALRFLRDVAKQGGGLQTAVRVRGGITKIRCLAAREQSNVKLAIELSESDSRELCWHYELNFKHTGGGIRENQVKIVSEKVFSGREQRYVLDRSAETLGEDEETLKYTYLEQPNANKDFRVIQQFLQNVEYLNVVPQMVRESASSSYSGDKEDYYGRNFLKRLALLNDNTRRSYFRKINEFLKLAVPQLEELSFVKDEIGVPHLEARYVHWRARGSKQQEMQFSDGTLRLIGFLFALIDSNGVLLLEEPEINLHPGIVAQFPEFIAKIQRVKKGGRQVFITTHSYDILSNEGIAPEEVLLLTNSPEGTEVEVLSNVEKAKNILAAGFSMADVVMPLTKPWSIESMSHIKLD